MQTIKMWFIQYIPGLYIFRMPVGIIDIIEIILLSFLVYTILVWIKNTRAWTLLKGIIFLGFFVALIYLFHMDTLIFIINKGLNIAIIAAIIIFIICHFLIPPKNSTFQVFELHDCAQHL